MTPREIAREATPYIEAVLRAFAERPHGVTKEFHEEAKLDYASAIIEAAILKAFKECPVPSQVVADSASKMK
jgi:hypothetical protein